MIELNRTKTPFVSVFGNNMYNTVGIIIASNPDLKQGHKATFIYSLIDSSIIGRTIINLKTKVIKQKAK